MTMESSGDSPEEQGRRYVEDNLRISAISSVSELASALARAVQLQQAFAKDIDALRRLVVQQKRELDRFEKWMQGDYTPSGRRVAGVLDYVNMFLKWKNVITTLLAAIAVSTITGAILNAIDITKAHVK